MVILLNKRGANIVSEVHFTPFPETVSNELRVLNFLKRLWRNRELDEMLMLRWIR